jgi:hypothetical protein
MSSSQKRGEAYRAMLALLGSDVRYARHLCGAAQPADFEPLSQALIGVFGELRRPLVLVRAALAEESVLIMNYINLRHPPPIFHSLPLVPWLFFPYAHAATTTTTTSSSSSSTTTATTPAFLYTY